jgi:hypothetical protein
MTASLRHQSLLGGNAASDVVFRKLSKAEVYAELLFSLAGYIT